METQVNFLLYFLLYKNCTNFHLPGTKLNSFSFVDFFLKLQPIFFQSRTFLSSHCSGTDFYDRVYDEA